MPNSMYLGGRMRAFMIATLIVLCGCGLGSFKMIKYMEDTQSLERDGKYAEALERHIWFHDNALKEDKSMYGVRLSFALGYWWELGENYPPAQEAFIEMRDKKTQQLSEGKGDYDLFVDVSSLNEEMGEAEKTLALFVLLDEQHPDLAEECWFEAKDFVMQDKDYALAKKYLPDLMEEFRSSKEIYEMSSTFTKIPIIGGDDLMEIMEDLFIDDCLTLIEIAVGTGDLAMGKKIQQEALKVLADERLEIEISELGIEEVTESGSIIF